MKSEGFRLGQILKRGGTVLRIHEIFFRGDTKVIKYKMLLGGSKGRVFTLNAATSDWQNYAETCTVKEGIK